MHKPAKLAVATISLCLAAIAAPAVAANVAAEHGATEEGAICTGFGPQTPRDIDSQAGANRRVVSKAPKSGEMNLCNIHFHKNAEHKSKAYGLYAGDGDGHGYESGYMCSSSKTLSPSELKPTKGPICKSEHGDLKPGDTVEVHWVYTSCDIKGRDIKPGAALGACLTATCANPTLRVEAAVFTLVNDSHAEDFLDYDFEGNAVNGFLQPNNLPKSGGTPVEFIGSTTGPKYNEQNCSPLAVTWSVRPECGKLNINTLGDWCKANAYAEDHAHGVRKLVTHRKLLSKIPASAAPAAKPAGKPAASAKPAEKAPDQQPKMQF